MKFETKAIHIGEEPNLKEGGTGDVVAPIHLTSTYARSTIDNPASTSSAGHDRLMMS